MFRSVYWPRPRRTRLRYRFCHSPRRWCAGACTGCWRSLPLGRLAKCWSITNDGSTLWNVLCGLVCVVAASARSHQHAHALQVLRWLSAEVKTCERVGVSRPQSTRTQRDSVHTSGCALLWIQGTRSGTWGTPRTCLWELSQCLAWAKDWGA